MPSAVKHFSQFLYIASALLSADSDGITTAQPQPSDKCISAITSSDLIIYDKYAKNSVSSPEICYTKWQFAKEVYTTYENRILRRQHTWR